MPDDDPQLATKAEAAISKKDVEVARRKAEIAAIERQAKMDAWDDYADFIMMKLLGLAGLFVGCLEYLLPDALPIKLTAPGLIVGVGVALLFGNSFLSSLFGIKSYWGWQELSVGRIVFRLAVALLGVGFILIGYTLIESGIGFLGGLLLVMGIQTFCWVIGIRLQILGNVTNEVYDSQWEADASCRAPSAIQQ